MSAPTVALPALVRLADLEREAFGSGDYRTRHDGLPMRYRHDANGTMWAEFAAMPTEREVAVAELERACGPTPDLLRPQTP